MTLRRELSAPALIVVPATLWRVGYRMALVLFVSLGVFGAGAVFCSLAAAEYDEFGLVPGSGADELSIEDDILDPRWEAPSPPPRLPEGELGDDETLEEYLRAERDEPEAEESEAASADFHEDNWDHDKGAFPLRDEMDDELDGLGGKAEDW